MKGSALRPPPRGRAQLIQARSRCRHSARTGTPPTAVAHHTQPIILTPPPSAPSSAKREAFPRPPVQHPPIARRKMMISTWRTPYPTERQLLKASRIHHRGKTTSVRSCILSVPKSTSDTFTANLQAAKRARNTLPHSPAATPVLPPSTVPAYETPPARRFFSAPGTQQGGKPPEWRVLKRLTKYFHQGGQPPARRHRDCFNWRSSPYWGAQLLAPRRARQNSTGERVQRPP